MICKYGSKEEINSLHGIAYNVMYGEFDNYRKGQNIKKICQWWNRGYSREGRKCCYEHLEGDCEKYIAHGVCNSQTCRQA